MANTGCPWGSVALASLVLCACGEGAYSVSGTVIVGGEPADGATVRLDDAFNWQTETDAAGRFYIDGVSAGEHTLFTSMQADSGAFSERRVQLLITKNVDLDDLLLPEPIELFPPVATPDGLLLSWEPTDAVDFYEYDLYTHDTAGLDETTGELIFVGTAPDQTEFLHESVDGASEYFYRVFVMNEVGRLGGSNLTSAVAPIVNLIRDGDFEDPASLDNWKQRGGLMAALVSDVVQEGTRSLYLTSELTQPCCNPIVLDTDYSFRLVEGTSYELSAWVKTQGILTEVGPEIAVDGVGWSGVIHFDDDQGLGPGAPFDREWTLLSTQFVATSTGTHTLHIWGMVSEMWVDDLVLIPVP